MFTWKICDLLVATVIDKGVIHQRWLLASVLAFALTWPGAKLAAKEEPWLRVTTPEFTLVTTLKDKDARRWAAEFAQYVAALRSFFHYETGRLPPLTMVVFARERDFEKYRPLGANGKIEEVAGFFLRHESWAVAGLGRANITEQAHRTIFHECVHWFLSTQQRPNPVWIEEGMAEVFSTFDVVKDKAEWGKAIDEHVSVLRFGDPPPLEKLLFTGRGDLFDNDSVRTSMVYAESWAFIHYLIFGKHDLPRGALGDYADLMYAGVNAGDAFRRAFGKTYAQMDGLLAEYLRDGQYVVRSRPLAKVAEPKLEPATPLQLNDALGRLALAGRHWDLAETHARLAIAAAPDHPCGHELLGLALKEKEDTDGALAAFGRAVACKSRDFQPYFEVAMAVQNAGIGPAGESAMTAAEARTIANRYEQAINLHPRYQAAYQNLAGMVGIAEPVGPEDRNFLTQGQLLFPNDGMIQVGLAILSRRGGDKGAARAQLDKVLADESGSIASVQAFARRLDGAWEQEETFGELNRLAEGRNFNDALKLIDSRLARGTSMPVRMQLLSMRPPLLAGALMQVAEQALEEQRWIDARRALEKLSWSVDTPLLLRSHARRLLAELDKKGLGADETKKQP